MVCEKATPMREPAFDRDDGQTLYWIEPRPGEGGRQALVRRSPDGAVSEVLPPDFNTRTRVYEYGGRGYGVHGGTVVASNFADGRLYLLAAGDSDPRPLTPPDRGLRYGAPIVDPSHGVVFCIRERPADREPVDELVSVRLDSDGSDAGTALVSGPDFVSQHALSADGRFLAWVQWDHPNMPWDKTQLWVAELDGDANVVRSARVAGAHGECVGEPSWHPDGRLLFLSDHTGWANIYALSPDAALRGDAAPTALCPAAVEFGGPAWGLGDTTYAVVGDQIVAAWVENGIAGLGIVTDGRASAFGIDATAARQLSGGSTSVAVCCAYRDRPMELVLLSVPDGDITTVATSSRSKVDAGVISSPEDVSWRSSDGDLAHGFYYPPTNSGVCAPAGETPPLIVTAHGGPTGQSPAAFGLSRTYWTSRGFAVLDVNYGGSTGYGRAYRDRLLGAWGVVDVADCSTGALAMAEQGKADPARLAITGGSAGGFTVLACLTGTDTFGAGASHFGISDLTTLARDTHKFESRYLDSLVGPYPDRKDLYVERSPLSHVDQLSCPLVLFQGTEDTVVPPNQAEQMAAAVRAKGLPVCLVLMEGEGHGFRLAENQIRALEGELAFYGKVFGFVPADELPDLVVENLD
jgi:poly(3-hydroxybutyrate) depolymerase